MKKNCEHYMEEYLLLDKGQIVPLSLTFHLFACPKCRAEVRLLSKAQKLSCKPLSIPSSIENADITSIMQQIDPSYNPKKYKVSIKQWVIAGVLIILAMFLLALLTQNQNNQILSIAIYLASTAVLTSYCAIFIGTNLDFFIKKSYICRKRFNNFANQID